VETERTVSVETESGEVLNVFLYLEGDRIGTCLRIDGVPHHFERISADEMMADYRVDLDPDYTPVADKSGFCYILVPFSR